MFWSHFMTFMAGTNTIIAIEFLKDGKMADGWFSLLTVPMCLFWGRMEYRRAQRA